MARYTRDELNNDWEFKIVRSTWGAFRKPEVIQALIEEEALAGWQMVEKFDDYRIRFKRPSSARKRDTMLPDYLDPYRTNYGGRSARSSTLTMTIIGVLLLVLALGALALIILLRVG